MSMCICHTDAMLIQAHVHDESNHGLICHVEGGTESGFENLKSQWREVTDVIEQSRGDNMVTFDGFGKETDTEEEFPLILWDGNKLYMKPRRLRRVTRIV